MLKKISFIIAIFGISVLLSFLILPGKEIDEINLLEINEKIVLEGKVVSEKDFGDFKIWNVGGIEVVCDCEESYLNKIVQIVGVVSEFNDQKQVRVLEIRVLSQGI